MTFSYFAQEPLLLVNTNDDRSVQKVDLYSHYRAEHNTVQSPYNDMFWVHRNGLCNM